MSKTATLTDSELYEADFYLCTLVQAAKLRQSCPTNKHGLND